MATPLLMTPARRITLLLGVPAALIAIGWTALAAVAWAGRGSFPVHFSVPARGRQVTLSVGGGTVLVRPGTGSRVAVSGTVHYSLVRPKVSLRSAASGVAVDSSCSARAVSSCSFDYAVAVPAGLGADISVGSGDLSARGLSGPVRLAAQSGDITASALSGHVQIWSQSGDITATALSGPVTDFQDQAGNIKVTFLSGQDVTVSDQAGNITLDFAVVPRRVAVTVQAGNITLVLPPGSTAYRVTTRTSSGNTVTDVPTDPGSSHVITATAQSGDITIVR
jgi:DUF4097 and DUF4098 domain-containing protein YvlB